MRYHPLIWILIFLLANAVFPTTALTNASARLAPLTALYYQDTLALDKYIDWTLDWAKAPDRPYYTNKAPGPVLLAIPVFMPVYTAHLVVASYADQPLPVTRKQIQPVYEPLLSWALQVAPYAAVMYLIYQWMVREKYSVLSQHYTLLAIGFGNTISLMMNAFWGHPTAAVFGLLAALLFMRHSFFWAGFFIGWAALSDYPMVIPALFVTLVGIRYSWRATRATIMGGLLPAVIWSVYHQIAFGAPWSIAVRYSNPLFSKEYSQAQHQIWGQIAPQIDFRIIYELLFGQTRGLLLSQPWVLILLVTPFIFWKKIRANKDITSLILIAVPSLLIMILLNSTFNAWHSGPAPGPRYISSILPIMALVGGVTYDQFGRGAKTLLWLGLAVALLFFILMSLTDTHLTVDIFLWPKYLYWLKEGLTMAF